MSVPLSAFYKNLHIFLLTGLVIVFISLAFATGSFACNGGGGGGGGHGGGGGGGASGGGSDDAGSNVRRRKKNFGKNKVRRKRVGKRRYRLISKKKRRVVRKKRKKIRKARRRSGGRSPVTVTATESREDRNPVEETGFPDEAEFEAIMEAWLEEEERAPTEEEKPEKNTKGNLRDTPNSVDKSSQGDGDLVKHGIDFTDRYISISGNAGSKVLGPLSNIISVIKIVAKGNDVRTAPNKKARDKAAKETKEGVGSFIVGGLGAWAGLTVLGPPGGMVGGKYGSKLGKLLANSKTTNTGPGGYYSPPASR